jgi:hypothetical protein
MRKLVTILAVVCAVAGCDRRPFKGGSLGGYPDGPFKPQTNLVTQRDRDRNLLCIIAWRSNGPTGDSTSGGDNLVSAIHGRRVKVDPTRYRVYALQPDYKLEPINLPAEQRQVLFDLVARDQFDPRSNQTWQDRVAPTLKFVEWPGRPSVPIAPPSASPSTQNVDPT